MCTHVLQLRKHFFFSPELLKWKKEKKKIQNSSCFRCINIAIGLLNNSEKEKLKRCLNAGWFCIYENFYTKLRLCVPCLLSLFIQSSLKYILVNGCMCLMHYTISQRIYIYRGIKSFYRGTQSNNFCKSITRDFRQHTGTSALRCLHAMRVFIVFFFWFFVGRWFLLNNPNCFCLVLMRIYNIFVVVFLHLLKWFRLQIYPYTFSEAQQVSVFFIITTINCVYGQHTHTHIYYASSNKFNSRTGYVNVIVTSYRTV